MNRHPDSILEALVRKKPLDSFGLERHEGRLLMEKLSTPKVTEKRRTEMGRWDVVQTEGTVIAHRLVWTDLHFRNCDLHDLGLFNAKLSNCVFENCKLRNLGFWESKLSHCSFIRCDLRESALGGSDFQRPVANLYHDIVFDHCDLRSSAHSCENYLRCTFDHCRYGEIDFLGAVFEDCVFRGDLDDVTFRRDFDEKMPKNSMRGCDFREADLDGSQFYQIDVIGFQLPSDDDLIILNHGPQDWEEWSKQIQSGNPEGNRLFFRGMIQASGTPTTASRKMLRLADFTDAQINLLKEIGSSP